MKKILVTICLSGSIWLAGCDKDDENGAAYNDADRMFALKAAMSNTAEIDAGQLAITKGNTASVREFGSMMVKDHIEASNKLKTLASNYALSTPDSLDAEHVGLKNQLSAATGRLFDSIYIMSQVKDHQAAIALFESETKDGKAEDLKLFAEETLPNLRMHLSHADSIAKTFK